MESEECSERKTSEDDDYERLKDRLVRALSRLEGFEPDLDLLFVEEVARSAVLIERGEKFLKTSDCSVETYVAISDGIAKQASRIRHAMKELAASRAERMRYQSATSLVAQIKEVVDKVIRANEPQGQ